MITKIKAIRRQLASDCTTTIIRADQTGDLPILPYATYKIIGDRKGTGREDVSYVSKTDALEETRVEERNATISFNTYGTTHDNSFEVATKLRKWFVLGGPLYLDEWNVAIVSISDVQNRTTFLVDSYDEKWGFDVIIRYLDTDEHEIDYFDKVETEIIRNRE
ncbi:hypothetical protein ABIA69_003366 [Lysinibacillus parviboronicapiens]|uniref:Phage neck terminator protein gp12-like domain-containing protein n=1 Tax=Lysinibacillus parviboronicapiens TaxID=436516 RepID=A0ABV2PMK4_9BACI